MSKNVKFDLLYRLGGEHKRGVLTIEEGCIKKWSSHMEDGNRRTKCKS